MDNSIFSSGFLRRRALWIVPCALLFLLCGLVGYAQARPAEQASTPIIEVNPDWDYISGMDWPLGSNVQISIDDPATGQNPDFQFSAMAAEDPNWTTIFTLYFGSQYNLKPGDVVTASDGVTTKVHTATPLHIVGASVEDDTLWGTGEPGSNIHVNFGNSPRLDDVFVGLDGSWRVDFTDTYDVLYRDWAISAQYDEDQDRTSSKWVLPTMSVDRKKDRIWGNTWLPGGTVLISIYAAPGDPQPLQTFSVEAGYLEDDGCLGCFFLELSGQFDIQVGQWVAATDSISIKSLTVSKLQHTAFDFTLDTVTGIAEPGGAVNIDCNDEFEQIHVDRTVNPSSDGSWTADFANPAPDNSATLEFTPNILCTTNQQDSDADSNTYHEGSPEIEVEVDGNIWVLSHKPPVTVTIDDPDTGVGVDFSITVLDGRVSSDQLQGYVIQPGDLVTATDGDGYFTKQTVVTELAVTGVDVLNDRVYGTAAPGSMVELHDENWMAVIQTTTGADGNWVADFSGLFDIVNGSLGGAVQYDVDYDSTSRTWDTLSCPPGDSISGHVWLADGVTPAPGATVTIEAYDQPHVTLYSFNTQPDGSYTCGLPEGAYRLSANSMNPPDTLYSSEYYPETIFENAEAVQVQAGSSRSGVDFTLDTPAYIFDHMTFNFNEPVIAQLAVRQAIAFGADRQRMIGATYPASPFQDSILITPYWPYTSQSLIQYGYDPLMARRILDQAGWVDADGDGVREKDGVRLHLKYATTDQEVRRAIADIFTENMRAIGLEVELIILPGPISQWFSNYPDLSIAQFAWVQDVNQDDPQGMIWKQGSSNNLGGYANLTADQLLNLASLFGTRAEMKPYLEHYQRVVMADLPLLPLLLRIETLDRDGDGVPDGDDQCPDVSSEGYDADVDGCLDTSQGLKDLINKLYAENEIKKAGTRDSLLNQVNKVDTQLSKGNYTRAVQELDNFIKMVNDELKKKNLTQTAADQLIAYAESLMLWIDDKYIVGLGAGMERAWLPLFSPARA